MASPSGLNPALPFLERIDNEYLIAGVILAGVLLWRGPAYIKAIGEVVRLGKANNVDVTHKKVMFTKTLEEKLAKLTQKRETQKRDTAQTPAGGMTQKRPRGQK